MNNTIKLALAGLASVCALVAVPATAGIANTKHNLSPGGAAGQNKVTAGTDELCVFCHTPHAADTTAPAPLWNKALGSLTGYSTYATLNSSTIDGTILSVGSISLACLVSRLAIELLVGRSFSPSSGIDCLISLGGIRCCTSERPRAASI